MNNRTGFLLFTIIALSFTFSVKADWKKLERGLELGEFSPSAPRRAMNSKIHILRIDLRQFELKLLNASAPGQGRLLTAKQWSRKNGLTAAINASMYQIDYKTSVSYMRTEDHINNPWLSKNKSIFAFNRKSSKVPPVKIIDRECEDFDSWKKDYRTFIQSIRMVSCKGRNVWVQQPEKWSIAAVGIDDMNKVLFIHSRSPFSTHDFINILKTLPIGLKRAMYLEGGLEAQLYINSNGSENEFVGMSEATAGIGSTRSITLPIPNVIGIIKKK